MFRFDKVQGQPSWKCFRDNKQLFGKFVKRCCKPSENLLQDVREYWQPLRVLATFENP
jgi:hypothetical protein